MYNISFPIEKKWIEPFLRFVALIEVIFISIIILIERIQAKDLNLIYSNCPARYSCRHFIFYDNLQYKSLFIFFGKKINQKFIKNKFLELDYIKDHSGKRNSKRNIFIRKEFEMYKSIVNSNWYEKIIFDSILFGDGLNSFNKAIKDYEFLHNKKIDSFIEKRTNIDLRISFPEELNITRNAIIEYEFFRSQVYEEFVIDFYNLTFREVIGFLENKYSKSFENLSISEYENILFKLNNYETFFTTKSKLEFAIQCTKKAIVVASFIKDEKVENELTIKFSKLSEIYTTDFC